VINALNIYLENPVEIRSVVFSSFPTCEMPALFTRMSIGSWLRILSNTRLTLS